MDDKQMIDDFIKMMDSGMAQGVGHVNVDVDANADNSKMCRPWGARIAHAPRWPAAFPPSTMGWTGWKILSKH